MMLTQSLPATVEELNSQQNLRTSPLLSKKSDFEDIPVIKRLKREVSLPNGVENWNINIDSYLNFDDYLENAVVNSFDVLASPEDRLVPDSKLRDRSSSISSVSSVLDEKQVTFHNFGVKTINTVSMDSGSTCISSDHTYFGKNTSNNKSLDPEETYQNLDVFLQQVPEMTPSEVLAPSTFPSLASTNSNDSFEYTMLEPFSSFSESPVSSDSVIQDFNLPSTSTGLTGSLKRPLETIDEDEVFIFKQVKREESAEKAGATKYREIRQKNNVASKVCRRTRKEKQKDMDVKVIELEKERESLKVQVDVLEKLIAAYKQILLNSIAQRR